MVSYAQTHKYCRRCGRYTLHYRKAADHFLNFVLTICTCGMWLLVWALQCFKVGGWRCQECGKKKFRWL